MVPNLEGRSVVWWISTFLGLLSWTFALLCLFLALRFRLAPIPGDESDIGVGIALIGGWPLPAVTALFSVAPSIRAKWKSVLIAPCAILAAALGIASIGITARP